MTHTPAQAGTPMLDSGSARDWDRSRSIADFDASQCAQPSSVGAAIPNEKAPSVDGRRTRSLSPIVPGCRRGMATQ